MRNATLLIIVLLFTGCGNPDPVPTSGQTEVVSLLGNVLTPPPLAEATRATMEAQLAEARMAFDANPTDLDAIIWYGRRTAYLWRYHEAIGIYSSGLAQYPDEPHLLRHRGHRYISVRNFDAATADFMNALASTMGQPDEVEPDGQPNAAGIPTSTLQTNIYYHLGLTQYLQGDFIGAASSFEFCRLIAQNDDMRVAAADWEYMARRRAGLHEEAAELISFVTPEMELLENHVYKNRILMYQGLIDPDSLLGSADGDVALNLATQGYGVGNWYLVEGDTARALDIFQDVLGGEYWAAFGYIAAEADVARLTASSIESGM